MDLFGGDDMMAATCAKDVNCKTEEQGKTDLFKRLRPGEVPTIEGADILINNTFFEYKKYDLARSEDTSITRNSPSQTASKGRSLHRTSSAP